MAIPSAPSLQKTDHGGAAGGAPLDRARGPGGRPARPPHTHQRRAAPLQLHAVGGELRRAVLHRWAGGWVGGCVSRARDANARECVDAAGVAGQSAYAGTGWLEGGGASAATAWAGTPACPSGPACPPHPPTPIRITCQPWSTHSPAAGHPPPRARLWNDVPQRCAGHSLGVTSLRLRCRTTPRGNAASGGGSQARAPAPRRGAVGHANEPNAGLLHVWVFFGGGGAVACVPMPLAC